MCWCISSTLLIGLHHSFTSIMSLVFGVGVMQNYQTILQHSSCTMPCTAHHAYSSTEKCMPPLITPHQVSKLILFYFREDVLKKPAGSSSGVEALAGGTASRWNADGKLESRTRGNQIFFLFFLNRTPADCIQMLQVWLLNCIEGE